MRALFLTFAVWIGSLGAPSAAELKVLASIATRDLLEELAPALKAALGSAPSIEFSSAAALQTKVAANAPFDAVVTFAKDIEDMDRKGVTAGTGAPVGIAYLGIIYRKGEQPPRAATLDEFKTFLQGAPTFASGDPALGGIGPVLLAEYTKKLGLEDIFLKGRVLAKPGEAAALVASGRAAYGIAQTTEIARIPGVAAAKFLTEDPRTTTRISAAAARNAADKTAAEKFVAFLASDATKHARTEAGFELP